MATDLYAILEVNPAASQAEITRAYRLLVRRHHPDTRAPGEISPIIGRGVADDSATRHDAALQDVVAAYRVLHDPVRRAEYDKRRQPRPPLAPKGQRRTARPESDRPPIIAGPVYWQPPRPQ